MPRISNRKTSQVCCAVEVREENAMWQNESESKYSSYLNSKHLIVSGKPARRDFGGKIEIPSPNHGATAPVMHHPHPCQMSKSRLPLKMVVSDVVHRDIGPLQQPSPSPSRFIVTPKTRNSPYDYYKNVVHRRSRSVRNHPIVDEIQKKFNSIYGCHFQNAKSNSPCTSTSLEHESPRERGSIEQESSIPKFSAFYKEYLQKQRSVSEEIKISNSCVYNNSDHFTSEENETENDESKKANANKEEEHFMLAKNFLHTIEEKQSQSKEENDSPTKYSKYKSEDEYSSSSSQEYGSQNDNFCFTPLLEERKEGFVPSNSKMIPQTWTLKQNCATNDSKCKANDQIGVIDESFASNTSEEDTDIWFADDHDEDLN